MLDPLSISREFPLQYFRFVDAIESNINCVQTTVSLSNLGDISCSMCLLAYRDPVLSSPIRNICSCLTTHTDVTQVALSVRSFAEEILLSNSTIILVHGTFL